MLDNADEGNNNPNLLGKDGWGQIYTIGLDYGVAEQIVGRLRNNAEQERTRELCRIVNNQSAARMNSCYARRYYPTPDMVISDEADTPAAGPLRPHYQWIGICLGGRKRNVYVLNQLLDGPFTRQEID